MRQGKVEATLSNGETGLVGIGDWGIIIMTLLAT